MSIAILNQVYEETRRLAIAGSTLAKGDFRLQKLVPPLEKAAQKAPVFGQVAKAIKNLIEGTESNSPQALLDLGSLLVAILYTQGETGVKGTLKGIESTEIEINSTQASARILKPLIEALTTTGSGRLNTIKESFEQGAFEDLRLVNYAIAALDDKFREVGDFVAENILPTYGKAILPQIKDKIDIKGSSGSARRLKLLYQLAPEIARPIVLEAFEKGNKQMRIVALGCLGDSTEDLPHLLQQATAKNKEVRQVAFSRLAKFKDKQTIDLFSQALRSNDLNIVAVPISQSKSPKLINLAIAEVNVKIDQMTEQTADKTLKANLEQICGLLDCFRGRSEKGVVTLLANLFENRIEYLPNKKSLQAHRSKVESNLVQSMLFTLDNQLLKMLADAHDEFDDESFYYSMLAARCIWKPAEVFERFAPYYQATLKSKRKSDTGYARKEMVAQQLAESGYYRRYQYVSYHYQRESPELNQKLAKSKWAPGWLDAAIEQDDLSVVRNLADPKNKKIKAFVENQFNQEVKRSDSHELSQVLELAINIKHPNATSMLIEALTNVSKRKNHYYSWWLFPLISRLPNSSAKKIEKAIESLPESFIDQALPHLQTLKAKKKN